LLATLALAGCITVGPDYAPPANTAPAQWGQLDGAAEPAADAAPTGDLSQWWSRLQDPMLAQLVDEALRANPDLQGAQARLRESRARRGIAAADFYPAVGASATGSRVSPSEQVGGGPAREAYDAGFDASWEIDVFGSTRRSVEAADADVGAASANLEATQVTLAAEVAANYVEVRAQQALIRIARDNLASQTETLQIAEWREQAGLATRQDVEQARTNRERTSAAIPALEISLAEAEHRLDTLLGLAPGTLHARLAGSSSALQVPDSLAVGIPADTLRQRPDVRAAERLVAAETARIGVAEAARYPSFGISGSVGLEALTLSGLNDGGAGTSSLFGGITAPVFEGGRLRQQVVVQEAIRDQAAANYTQTVLAALQEVENALVAVSRNRERDVALTRAVDSARIASQLARARYGAGLIDFQTVLDTDLTVLTVEESLARTRADGLLAVVGLYKSLGGGWSPSVDANADATEVTR
jgi:NodT family efflux transporter outer membrane factor (OMF) lipoprotein